MDYVPQCPHCAHVLEQPPELAPVQTEYAPEKPLEPAWDLPAPGGAEPLDMAGVWTGVMLLLLLLGIGLMLLFCHHTEPEKTQQPIVVVREGKIVAALTLVTTVIGLPFLLLAAWMLLAGRNRALFVFRDNSLLYISSWGRRREFAPGQVASVRLTANRSIHLLDKDGKKLASVETNMRGIPRFAEWIESTDLDTALTPTMEKQAKQESTVQWREEYRTHWHDHIKSIRAGLRAVLLWFAAGVIAPIPLFLFAGVKFRVVMTIGALAPIPFLVFCLIFALVLLFDDEPQNATSEWNAMHIKIPMIPVILIGLLYIGQVYYFWDGWVFQEADAGWGWLARILVIDAVLTILLILRAPKRMRMRAGFFMGFMGVYHGEKSKRYIDILLIIFIIVFDLLAVAGFILWYLFTQLPLAKL